MKRIGTRIRPALAAAVALGVALTGWAAAAPPAEAARPRLIADVDWDTRPTLYGGLYSHVRLDVERIEKAHEGLPVPALRMPNGEPVFGMPYYFLSRDPATGAYLPDSILVCIDVLHVDYRVPDGSEYFDLATLVPEETAVRISRTLNAGLQLAAQRGLTIATDGSQPLTFRTAEASDVMLAAQISAWHLFARDNVSQPLPHLELRDFSVDKRVVAPGGGTQTLTDIDLTPQFAELDREVARFDAAPTFTADPVSFGERVSLSDPDALAGFSVEVDPARSTPGYDDYLGVATSPDGSIQLTKKKPVDRPLSLGFRKTFAHGLGGGPFLGTGVRAANDQIKTVLSNVFESAFELAVDEDFGPVDPPVYPPSDPMILPAVSIAKDDGRTAVVAGDRLDYVLVAANSSDIPAPDVVVTDTLPEHLELVDSAPSPSEVSPDGTLVWAVGALAPGESTEILVSATVRDDVVPGTDIVNTASITSEGVCEGDPGTDAADPCEATDVDIVVPPLDGPPADDPGAEVTASGATLANTGDPLLGAGKVGALAVALFLTGGGLALAHARSGRSDRG